MTRGNNSVVTGLSGSGARVSPIIQVGDQNSDMDTSRAALESLRVSDIEKNLAADQKRNGSGEKQSPVFSTRSNSRDVEKGASY